MAFDAHWEDYQRLSLRFARTLTGSQAKRMRAYARFGYQFATNRDALPQTDSDRAFHLVADATTLIDYELPSATNEEAETIETHARHLLEEALALDEHCYDALRMLYAADAPSTEDYYQFLCEHEDEVLACCQQERSRAKCDESADRVRVGVFVAMLPYLRWIAMLADKAVVCGRGREALRHARKAIDYDPYDAADLRRTVAYAFAILEDRTGIERLIGRTRRLGLHANDAWLHLAMACIAHREHDFAAARTQLARIAANYPNAPATLARQLEVPDGVFARLAMPPNSEDELVVAVSEGVVLLREGRDELGMGVFGSWVMREALKMIAREQLDEVRDLIELSDGMDGR